MVDGKVIGAVGVSGVTGDQDEQMRQGRRRQAAKVRPLCYFILQSCT